MDRPEAVAVLAVRAAPIEALERLEQPADFVWGDDWPLLATDSTALPSFTPVETQTWPSTMLCPMALSTRLATRHSMSMGSPSSRAERMPVSTCNPRRWCRGRGVAKRFGRCPPGRSAPGGRGRLRCWRE